MSDAAGIPEGWEGILTPGERILWQGRPDAAPEIGPVQIAMAVFGGLFALGGLVLLVADGAVLVGPGFAAMGVYLAWEVLYGPARRRAHTWYTLTDRRAFIATDLPRKGRRIKDYPISFETEVRYREGELSTILFAQEVHRVKNRTQRRDIGFERIAEGPKVRELIRRIQRGEA